MTGGVSDHWWLMSWWRILACGEGCFRFLFDYIMRRHCFFWRVLLKREGKTPGMFQGILLSAAFATQIKLADMVRYDLTNEKLTFTSWTFSRGVLGIWGPLVMLFLSFRKLCLKRSWSFFLCFLCMKRRLHGETDCIQPIHNLLEHHVP